MALNTAESDFCKFRKEGRKVRRDSRRRSSSHPPRRGAILVLSAILLVVLLGMLAFSVDVGYMMLVRTQLQAAADSAALAGASQLGRTHHEIHTTADRFAAYHRAGNATVRLLPEDVEIGIWDSRTRSFTPNSQSGNAVRVTARRDAVHGGEVPLFFGRLLGRTHFRMEASAVATANARDIALVVDLSGSMNDDTEPCWATQEINSTFGPLGYPSIGTQLMEQVYRDFGFGAFPGTLEYLGRPWNVPANRYAYAELTKDNGPLAQASIPAKYRILPTDNEATRKRKAYSAIIDYQIARVMPAARPAPDSSLNYAYWEKYLDYIIEPVQVVGSPPPSRPESRPERPPQQPTPRPSPPVGGGSTGRPPQANPSPPVGSPGARAPQAPSGGSSGGGGGGGGGGGSNPGSGGGGPIGWLPNAKGTYHLAQRPEPEFLIPAYDEPFIASVSEHAIYGRKTTQSIFRLAADHDRLPLTPPFPLVTQAPLGNAYDPEDSGNAGVGTLGSGHLWLVQNSNRGRTDTRDPRGDTPRGGTETPGGSGSGSSGTRPDPPGQSSGGQSSGGRGSSGSSSSGSSGHSNNSGSSSSSATGTPPYNRGTLPPNQSPNRIDRFNNPNPATFPQARVEVPRSYRNKIGYLTYVQFMMDHGRDIAPDGRTFVPLSLRSPDCPRISESTAGGTFNFPPREQPVHAARRAIIAALQVIKERNRGVAPEQADWVSIISFDKLGGGGPMVEQPLTANYDAAMRVCTRLQAVGDIGASTATEAGIVAARNHIKPRSQGGAGRENTNKVIVLLTDGVPNLYVSSAATIRAFMASNPSPDFYGGNRLAYDAALMQAMQVYQNRWQLFPVGLGLGTDYDFMDRMARLGGTANDGRSPRGSGNPAEYEARLREIFERIITNPQIRLVD